MHIYDSNAKANTPAFAMTAMCSAACALHGWPKTPSASGQQFMQRRNKSRDQ